MGLYKVKYYYSWPAPVETLIELRCCVRLNRGSGFRIKVGFQFGPSPEQRILEFSAPFFLQTKPYFNFARPLKKQILGSALPAGRPAPNSRSPWPQPEEHERQSRERRHIDSLIPGCRSPRGPTLPRGPSLEMASLDSWATLAVRTHLLEMPMTWPAILNS